MKLIIDIPEIFYQNEKENKGYVSDLKRDIVWDAMIKGTPFNVLDKIKAEIEGLTYYWCEVNPKSVINDVLQIIDKYTEGESK